MIIQRQGAGCLGCLGYAVVLGILMIFVSVVLAVFIGIGLLAVTIYRYLFTPQARYFGAVPMSRWVSWYEHTAFVADTEYGVDMVSSPGRVWLGSILITMLPAIALFVLFGGSFGWLLIGGGLVVGILTGLHLTQPMEMFDAPTGTFLEADPLLAEDYLLLNDPLYMDGVEEF